MLAAEFLAFLTNPTMLSLEVPYSRRQAPINGIAREIVLGRWTSEVTARYRMLHRHPLRRGDNMTRILAVWFFLSIPLLLFAQSANKTSHCWRFATFKLLTFSHSRLGTVR
jgi:hypothetical protein